MKRPWRLVPTCRSVTGSLRRQLVVSHLAVAFLTLVLVVGAYAAIAFVTRGAELLSQRVTYDPDFAQGTRLLAELLPPHVRGARDDPRSLETLLSSLRADAAPGSGPLGGTVNDATGIAVVAPDGTILAAIGTSAGSLQELEPPEWREAFRAALGGVRDLSAGGPLVRNAERGTTLVSAYPIVAPDGTLLGAVGLRTQPIGTVPASWWGRLGSLVVGLGLVIGDFLVTAAIPAAVASTAASLILTRRMRRQLRELESATDAIVRGELGRRVAIVADDELGRLAERFNTLTAALERLERQRRALFADVTHDLRTPLALIRAQAEALLERRELADSVTRDGLERIVEETETLGRLVEDVFALARLEERGLPLQLVPVELGPLVREVVEAVRPLARRAGRVTVIDEIDRDCPPVRADPLRLRQVLLNLVHNAVRHTPEGGIVRVCVVRGSGTITVQVCDTGTGLPPELLDEPFRRYQRSGDPASGSGLGLAVARQLVEAQGGTIWLESAPGQGTTVSFALPVADPRPVRGDRGGR
ncbi:MAG: HAMP domain-containing sensor histidine kinase [Thermomicrobium sp.]|nr:HAMP domain-containing histidine kinase [Thermomicrobium sp.]MDW8058848.1 HAMP domain-containing sensor histidine kinase [Thermomicrobium sp.]